MRFSLHTLSLNIKMRTLCLILLINASLQLQCDKGQITAHIGGEFILSCTYDTKRFLFSKKYWCRGDTRGTCEILVDSERANAKGKSHIIDAGRRGLFVKVTNLRFEDAGMYWVGIDKIYADIMTSVNVIVTEVPVSKPRLWPLSSLVDRPTCWGQQVTVRCGCTKGTGIRYAWHQHIHHKDYLLHHSPDLNLHCGTVEEDSEYYCIASNDISSQRSEHLSVQVLMPANSGCIYVINMQGQPIYDCADRMSTTTAKTPPLTCTEIHSNTRNLSSHTNHTDQHLLFSTAWTGVPLWYALLRWTSFASLLMVLGIVLRYTKTRHNIKRAERRRKVHFSRVSHLTL